MKSENYTFNTEPTEPSNEAIQKHKNFEALIDEFESLPQEPPKKWAGKIMQLVSLGIAAAMAILLIYNLLPQEQTPEVDYEAQFASLPYVNPPINKIQKSFATKDGKVNEGGTYTYANGSKLIVPPAAFVDENGVVAKGEIQILYREFHDFVDFFLSGIPMEYDSAGTKYILESAGMMEIYAEQNGKRLSMAPDKEIKVEMVSQIFIPAANRGTAPKYNIYSLDTAKRNWVYEDVDDIEILNDPLEEMDEETVVLIENYKKELEDINNEKEQAEKEIESSLPKPLRPLKPERANGSDFVFDFNFSNVDGELKGDDELDSEIDELNAAEKERRALQKTYEGTLWQVAPGNVDFNPDAMAGINWEDMQIKPLNGKNFELTLIKGNTNKKLIVNPVLTGENYEKAMQQFNTEFSEYQQAMDLREAELTQKKVALDQRIALLEEATEQKYEERIAAYKAAGLDHLATNEVVKQKIINRFEVNKLGIWNCDRPLPPYIMQLNADFVDNNQKGLYGNPAFLVDHKRNTLKRFYSKKNLKFQFNNDTDNLLWIITKENKLALARQTEFAGIKRDEPTHTFVMDVIEKDISSEEDIRSILNFN